MGSAVARAFLRLTGAALVIVAVVAAVAPRPAYTRYHWYVVVPTMVVLVALALLVRIPRALENRWLPVVVAVLGGGLTTAVGQLSRYNYGWDARVVMSIARHTHAGLPLSDYDARYLSLYPNNIPLVAIDRLGTGIGARLSLSPDAVLITLTGLCVAVTLYAVHLLIVPVAGRGPALVAQVVLVGLVGVSPWVSVPYTDLYAMPFVIGGIALGLAALRRPRRWQQLVLGLLAVAAVAVAYVVKTTPAVIVVAAWFVGLLHALGATGAGRHGPAPAAEAEGGVEEASAGRGSVRVTWRRLAATTVVLVIGTGLFLAIGSALPRGLGAAAGVDADRIEQGVTPPLLWWVANGMNEVDGSNGNVRYGSYNRTMVTAIEGLTQDEMKAYARDYIAARWDERGLPGMASFYGNKLVWNWNDSMFWAYGEGRDAREMPIAGPSPLVSGLYSVNGIRGELYPLRADLTQGLWLTVLLVAGLGLLRARPRTEVLMLAVTVLGITAFTLVFQGRSRYLFSFVPVVVALAACVHSALPWRSRPGGRRRPRSVASTSPAPVDEAVRS